MGSPLGQLLLTPLAMGVVLAFGVTWGYGSLGVAVALLGFPLVLWLLRSESKVRDQAAAQTEHDGQKTRIAQAVRAWPYWVLSYGMFVCGFTSAGVVITHLIPLASDAELPLMSGAIALSVIGVANSCGVLITSYLIDKIGRVLPLSALFILRSMSLLAIPLVTSIWPFLMASVAYGATHSATMTITAVIIGDRFGKRSVGTLYGFMLVGHQIGAALGAYLGGAMFDKFHSYDLIFQGAAAFSFTVGLSSLLLLTGAAEVDLKSRNAPQHRDWDGGNQQKYAPLHERALP